MNEYREAQSILTSTSESLQQKKPIVNWLPDELKEVYYEKDLTYSYCLSQFSRIEANKREKIPETTMRSWFLEFVRMGWTKDSIKEKTDILMGVKIYGIEKLEIADWINAVKKPTINKSAYAPYIPPKQLSNGEKMTISQVIRDCINQIDAKYNLNKKKIAKRESVPIDNTLQDEYIKSLKGKKKQLAELSMKEKMKIVDELFKSGKIKGEAKGFGYNNVLHNLEDYEYLI